MVTLRTAYGLRRQVKSHFSAGLSKMQHDMGLGWVITKALSTGSGLAFFACLANSQHNCGVLLEEPEKASGIKCQELWPGANLFSPIRWCRLSQEV